MRGEKGHQPYKSPGSHFSLRGRDLQECGELQQWPPDSLSVSLSIKAAISNQNRDPQYLEDRVLFPPLARIMQDAPATPTQHYTWQQCLPRLEGGGYT